MEDLLLALLEPLLEIFGELLLEMFSELSAYVLHDFIQAWMIGPAVSAIGLLLAGAATGFLSALGIPYRLILTHVSPPGISLLLAPAAAGSAMYFAGKLLRRFGWGSSIVASFRGGALFAFSMALVRWLLVPMHLR